MKLPKWLSKANFERIQSMDAEEAMEEVERLKEKERARQRAWRKANKEKAAKMARDWRKKNKKRANEISRQCKEAIRNDPIRSERKKEVQRAWHANNTKERVRFRSTPENREYCKTYYYRRKTRVLALSSPDTLRRSIAALVPGYLQPAAKADVINSVMELALANKVDVRDIKASVKVCVSKYNRQFDNFKNVSIDAPMPGTENLKRSDTIESTVFHF